MVIKIGSRKIQSIDYSFLVCIPKVWLNHVEKGKGDHVHMSMDDRKLILEVENEQTQ